jgi:hypothetical protein
MEATKPIFWGYITKSKRIGIAVLLILMSASLVKAADGWDIRFFGINYKDFENRKAWKVVVGGLSSWAVHELGHMAAAELTGMDASMRWDNGPVVWADDYENKSDDQKAFYHAGGFISQVLVGTIFTAIPKTRHSDFMVGFTGFTMIGNTAYGITGGVQGEDYSDVENLNDLGYNGNAIAIGAGLYSGVLTYINIDKEKGEVSSGSNVTNILGIHYQKQKNHRAGIQE